MRATTLALVSLLPFLCSTPLHADSPPAPRPLEIQVLTGDAVGRQIDFRFSESVLPTLVELKAAYMARSAARTKAEADKDSLRERLRRLKDGALAGAAAADEMDAILDRRDFQDGEHSAVVDAIKAYIQSRIRLQPAVTGTFVWTSPTALSFVLDPMQIGPWGGNVQVEIQPIRPFRARSLPSLPTKGSAYFNQFSKSVGWEVEKGFPRFVTHLGYSHYANFIGRGPWHFSYDQPVALPRLRKHLSLTRADGTPVAYTVLQPGGFGGAFELPAADHKRIYALRIDEPLKEGEALSLALPNWSKDGDPEAPALSRVALLHRGAAFKLLELSHPASLASGRAPLKTRLVLKFSSFVSQDGLRNALAMKPAPPSQQLRPLGEDGAELSLELAPGTGYQLSLARDFVDTLGNPLEEPLELSFTAQDLPPSLTAPDKPLVLEPGRASLPFQGLNLASVEVRVYEFPSASAYIKARNAGSRATASAYGLKERVQTFSRDLGKDRLNEVQAGAIVLDASTRSAGAEGPLRDGYKCLDLVGKGRGSERTELKRGILAAVSDIGITAKVSRDRVLVWLASFSEARPLPGRPIQLLDANGAVLAQGSTNEDGVGLLIPRPKVRLGAKRTYYVAAGDGAILALRDDELSNAWQFSLPGAVGDAAPLRGSLFTERGVYRPGDKVYVKGYAYTDAPAPLSLLVKDPRAKEVYRAAFKPDAYGAADFKFTLPEGAAVGDYTLLLSNGSSHLTRAFKVEEYRVPTFLVSLDDGAAAWRVGRPVNIAVGAKYYHGGLMGSREYRWQLSRTYAPFHAKDFPGYVFQSEADGTAAGIVGSGEGTLDGEGQDRVSFTPDHDALSGRMNYTFEATVTDNDRQAYSSRVSRLVSPADVYVGVKPPAREVVPAGTRLKLPVVLVDPDGRPVKGEAMKAKVERIQYHQSARQFGTFQVQMLNRMVGDTVSEGTLKSGATPVDFEFTPQRAGIYRLSFSAVDGKGGQVRTSAYVLASGDEPIAWPRFDYEKIELVKDKDSYRVGDTARLVPQTPYKKATGLLSVEVDGVISTRVVSVGAGSPEIRVPILEGYAPNAYVSLVLLRGREHTKTDALGFETGAPGFKMGYASLDVDPADKRLAVEIDKSLSHVKPKQSVEIKVQVKDAQGAAQQSQLAVMVVDEAVLAMTGYRTPQPLDDVHGRRRLAVRTGSNWLDLAHSRRERLEALFPAGDGEAGIGARSDLDAVLRNLFKSTAYWDPALETGADGKASFTFTMPDNLTSYRVMVVAAGKGQRFGSDEHSLTSRQPLMIQPVLPRFLHPEDELQVEAMVFNNTGKAESVAVRAEMKGLSLAAGESAQKSVEVAAGKSASVPFKVTAGPAGTALVRFEAVTPRHKDAGEYKLPIRDPGTSETRLASAKAGEGVSVALALPAHHVKGTAKAELVLSVTELTELKDSVQYLMRYPNGCIEQTTSVAYPLVVLKELLPVIGVEVNEGDLKKFSEAGVERILSFQTSKGGLSYWPGGQEPHAFATAFGLTALIAAKSRGYKVPDKALAGMADYLEEVLRSGQISGEMPHGGMADADTRALFLMTLGRLGRPQPQQINALWEKRKAMTGFGLSFLAVAVQELKGGDQSLLEPILQAIKEQAVRKDDEAHFEGEPKGGWSMDSPLRTHAASLIAYGASGKDAVMNGQLLNGFLARRTAGYGIWGNTQENVFGVMGVLESVGKRKGKGVPAVGLTVNGRDVPFDSMEAPDSRVRRIRYSEDELGLASGASLTAALKGEVAGGVLSLRLSYDVPLAYADLSARSEGFRIERSYESLDGEELDLDAIPLGTLLRVRLKVSAASNQNYVAIDDKLPAGLEPLNTALSTTERVDQGELSQAAQKGLSVLSYKEVRDHRVAFYADELLAGDYEFSYEARATTPGSFLRPQARVEAMYATDVFGRTSADEVVVK